MPLKISDIEKDYTIEIALIILLLRYYFQTATLEEVFDFVEGRKDQISWQKFKSLAAYHRIRPLVFKQLVKLDNIEPDLKKDLIEDIRHFTLTNFQLVYEAKRVIQLFQEQGITAIPYKGPFLSKVFYGDYDSRESSDIDLLIQWDDLKRCINILQKEGYIAKIDFFKYYGDNTRYRENEYNMDFYENGIRKFHIELHWEIGNSNLHPLTGVYSILKQESDLIHPDGIKISLTRASHAFATLIHHAIKDTFGILRNISDLATIFSTLTSGDISELKLYLDQTSFHRQASSAIQISNHFFALNITAISVEKNIDLKLFNYLLLDSSYRSPLPKDIFYSIRKRLIFESDTRNKFQILTAAANPLLYPNLNDQVWLPLPQRLHWLYLILKPIRIIYQHTIGAIKK
jgi:hypothetical protein